ncbi:hypothetical protein B0H12DRAFT_626350 [Mycena haematopus]|nr:hypothetical protein B0H12DRAFT_626350 [Mycena haematopus]
MKFDKTVNTRLRQTSPNRQPLSHKLMRDVEEEYYKLERTRNTPLSQPSWAVDPAQPLAFYTNKAPTVLEPYRSAMSDNLNSLLKDCGFQSMLSPWCTMGSIALYINFPAQIAAAAAAPQVPRTLHVEDEFSRSRGGRKRISAGAFGAGNFARLLADARNDGAAASGGSSSNSGSSANKKRRRTSRSVKEEDDDDDDGDDDNRSRLRSVTRASSAATMRSNPGSVRRSDRKRVKKEED